LLGNSDLETLILYFFQRRDAPARLQQKLDTVKQLGWTEIPVHVCQNLKDELAYLEAESDENTEREPLTPSEAHEQAMQLEPQYAKVAQKAAEAGKQKGGKTAGRGRPKKNSSTGTSGKANGKSKRAPNAKQQAAKTTGMDDRTLRKVNEIKTAAESDPTFQPFADALAKKGCKVDNVYKKYKSKEKEVAALAMAEVIAREQQSNPAPIVYHTGHPRPNMASTQCPVLPPASGKLEPGANLAAAFGKIQPHSSTNKLAYCPIENAGFLQNGCAEGASGTNRGCPRLRVCKGNSGRLGILKWPNCTFRIGFEGRKRCHLWELRTLVTSGAWNPSNGKRHGHRAYAGRCSRYRFMRKNEGFRCPWSRPEKRTACPFLLLVSVSSIGL